MWRLQVMKCKVCKEKIQRFSKAKILGTYVISYWPKIWDDYNYLLSK